MADASHGMVLGTPFGDGMVLQRDLPVRIWGWTAPGAQVGVAIAGHSGQAVADGHGAWEVTLPPLAAGGPHELVITASETYTLRDVLVGELWLASGQSNMVMTLSHCEHGDALAAQATNPQIRLLSMPVLHAATPQRKPASNRPAWVAASPQTAGSFSGVAYLYARELHEALNVPIGILVAARPNIPIEPWLCNQGIAQVAGLDHFVKANERLDQLFDKQMQAYEKAVAAGEAVEKPVHAHLNPRHAEYSVRRGMTTLFNGMISPLARCTMRGAIWYQGESNRGDSGHAYFMMMQALVKGWRACWDQGDFPFYFAQLASLESWRPHWQIPEIWEGQLMSLTIPNTGMAVIHDIHSDIRQIHPPEKQQVARRLSLWALKREYGKSDLVCSGPLFRFASLEGSQVRVEFDHTDGGLRTRDGQPPDWFSLAGPDLAFRPALARIDADTVVVWHDDIDEPVAVALGWHEAARPNLINGAGLPTSPFRSLPGR